MKKMFALLAVCVMATSLVAEDFNDYGFKNGKFTLPVVYTGMLKINGWGDEGLCYNWQQTRNSYPLFLGLCQPCLDCVPCDIDMRHLAPAIQYGDWSVDTDGGTGTINAVPNDPTKGGPDQTEAYFNRARLYLVNNIDSRNKVATVKVIDLIDAYWGKDDQFLTPVMFQFYNTVDSKFRTDKTGNYTTNQAYGRIAAIYQFPIFSRDFKEDMAVVTSKKGSLAFAEMANVVINQFNTDGDAVGHTNDHAQNLRGGENCVADRVEDGVGIAAVVGVKDYKAFFKLQNYPYAGQYSAYPVYTIKSFTGDFFAWQSWYRDTDLNPDERRAADRLQYVCRKGEDFVFYNTDYVGDVPESDQTEYDGKGVWYATGSIILRRNDAVTKFLMNKVIVQTSYNSCIPCQSVGKVLPCRQVLDNGIVENLINRQFPAWTVDYIVDLDNDGIYGETTACVNHVRERFADGDAYLRNMVNIYGVGDKVEATKMNDASAGKYYNLKEVSGYLGGKTSETQTR